MSCNAHNHPSSCECGFGGARPLSAAEDLPIDRLQGALARRRASCPYCGKSVYFVRGKNGGTFYLNHISPGWADKHECAALRRTSRPRVAMSDWRRKGWLPLAFVGMTQVDGTQVLDAVSLGEDGQFRCRVGGDHEIPFEAPAFYRVLDPLLGTLEIDYISDATGELRGDTILAEKLPD